MRKSSLVRYALALCVLSYSGAAAAVQADASAAPSDGSLCKPGETSWFETRQNEMEIAISLCGSKSLEGKDAWLQYRQARGGEDEMFVYPRERKGSLEKFTMGDLPRAGMTDVWLKFSDAGLDYRLHEHIIVSMPGAPEYAAGLTIMPASKAHDVEVEDNSRIYIPMTSKHDLVTLTALAGPVKRCDYDRGCD